MDIFSAGMQTFFSKRLDRREAELRSLLHSTNERLHEADEAGPRGVSDFKDEAAKRSLVTVDETTAEHAVHELDKVFAARHRLADHSYGRCAGCGEAIDLCRLMTLAATPCCTACQAIRQHEQSSSRRQAPDLA